MPAESQAQQRFMGAELGRLRAGKSTKTGMSETQLADFARKPKGRTLPQRAARKGGRR
jgi:hypothetical protein